MTGPKITSSADYVRITRSAFSAAGFEKMSSGETVYWTGGSGEPLVLVHGANDQAGTWFLVAPELAARHRVIIPDLAGHGESGPVSGPLPMELLLERLAAVIDAETGTRTIALAGNSLGGWLAMLYALTPGARVGRLLLETSGGLARRFAIDLVARTQEEAVTLLRAAHGPRFEPQQWQIDGVIARSADSPMLRITGQERHYLDSSLGAIRCPTTIIWGADDGIIPLDYAEALRDGIGTAALHVIPNAAHIPHLQQPAEFLRLMTEVLT